MSPTTAPNVKEAGDVKIRLVAIAQTLVLRFVLILVVGAANARAMDVVVSVPEQKLFVFNEGGERVASYRISTSAYGLGDGRGTYATPLGKLEVATKIGAGAPIGTVFKAGRRTGEICAVNAKGRDPIVTRILHLRGLEQHNARAYGRCIYIHGTPDERRLGKPVSYGCIRMASKDVAELFDMVAVGTRIEITQERSGVFMARRSTTSPAIAATAPPVPATPTKSMAVGHVTPGTSSAMVALSAKHAGPEPKVTRASGASIRLLETSGLTINFGGGGDAERSDRPR